MTFQIEKVRYNAVEVNFLKGGLCYVATRRLFHQPRNASDLFKPFDEVKNSCFIGDYRINLIFFDFSHYNRPLEIKY